MCEHARFTLARLNVYYNDGVYTYTYIVVQNIKIYFIIHYANVYIMYIVYATRTLHYTNNNRHNIMCV